MWFLRTSEKSIVWRATKENLYISDSVWMKAESSKKGLAILYKGDTYFKGRHELFVSRGLKMILHNKDGGDENEPILKER